MAFALLLLIALRLSYIEVSRGTTTTGAELLEADSTSSPASEDVSPGGSTSTSSLPESNSWSSSGNMPPLTTHTFNPASSSTLTGFLVTECNSATVPADAAVDDLTLVGARNDGGSCWADSRYSNSEYLVEKGSLVRSDGESITAYRVNPPQVFATEFVAADTKIFLRVSAGQKVMSFSSAGFVRTGPSGALLDAFMDSGVVASSLTASVVVFSCPSDYRFSMFPLLSETVAGAWISGSSSRGFTLSARHFPVGLGRTPSIPSTHWNYGPGTHTAGYNHPKQFVAAARADGSEGVVWHDPATRIVYMTWFAADLLSTETTAIYTPSADERFYAAASNGQDAIMLVTGENGDPPVDQHTEGVLRAVKVSSSTGEELMRSTLEGLNYWKFFASGASAAWDPSTNKVALILARLMTAASDGLNHQGAIAAIIDGDTLEVTSLGQTTSHSWTNSVILAEGGGWIAMDLGDNYPRGINVHLVGESSKSSQVVYRMKTAHATGCTGDSVYTEISTADVSYCKQSNDNKVYTEVGHPGVVEVDEGILVFFAGEDPPLDNSQIGDYVNTPRDLGFVKVSEDLQTVLSQGGTETGGFYNYGGGWVEQTNEGITWLTNFPSTSEGVSRLKTFRLSSSRVLLTYEVWTKTDYVRTEFLEVDATGGEVRQRWDASFPLRLSIADDGVVLGGKAIAYVGGPDSMLVRYEICAGDSCAGPGSPVEMPLSVPAPAPAPIDASGDEAPAGSVVTLEMVVAGVGFDGLNSDASLREAFVAAIKDGIVAGLQDSIAGFTSSLIAVTLQAGSVQVTSSITPPSGVNANTLATGVNQNIVQDGLGGIAILVGGVSGISTITTGAIGITASVATVVGPDAGGGGSDDSCVIPGCHGPLYFVSCGILVCCLCTCASMYFLMQRRRTHGLPPALETVVNAVENVETMVENALSRTDIESQFEVHEGKNTMEKGDAQILEDVTDVLACKRLCVEKQWGAVVMRGGNAYFKGDTADVCEKGLFDDKEATTYLVAEFSF